MIDGIRYKVCGLTSLVDADMADRCGADYLGFNLYPKSPRYLPLAQFRAMAKQLPDRKRGAVMVEPSLEDFQKAIDADFDYFQVHFREGFSSELLATYSSLVTPNKLWLAPRLSPENDLPAALAPLAKYFLLDTYHPDRFGGSGQTGDWAKFARHRARYSDKTLILAGGLSPFNVGAALKETGARFVDVNSGIETAPGVKDIDKLKAFVVAIHKAATESK